jgi:hypothetical protein
MKVYNNPSISSIVVKLKLTNARKILDGWESEEKNIVEMGKTLVKGTNKKKFDTCERICS